MIVKDHNHREENKLKFNYGDIILYLFSVTYYPAFRNTKTILEELQILLAPDKEHPKVFPKVPTEGFCNGKGVKEHLLRVSLPSLPILNNILGSEPCGKKNWPICCNYRYF